MAMKALGLRIESHGLSFDLHFLTPPTALLLAQALFPCLLLAQSTDYIDTRSLGGRGVAFEVTGVPDGAVLAQVQFVAGVGDLNGDGKDDIALDLPDPDALGAGKQLVLLYGQRGLAGKIPVTPSSGPPGTLFLRGRESGGASRPWNLQRAGDLDQDGKADLLFGFPAYRRDTAGLQAGEAYLIHGSDDLVGVHFVEEIGQSIRGVVFTSSDPSHKSIGSGIANVGDWNGDGRWDLVIGAPISDVGQEEAVGVVFILFGADELAGDVDLSELGSVLPGMVIRGFMEEVPDAGLVKSSWLGTDVRPTGDVNGDGLDDVLITAPGLFPRRVYLVLGRRDAPPLIELGRPQDRDGIIEISSLPIFAGNDQAAGIGDLNGDGLMDILVGRSLRGPIGSGAFVIYGRRDLPSVLDLDALPAGLTTAIRPFNLSGPRDLENFGGSVAGAGDLTGDGIPDLLIGANSAFRDGLLGVGEEYVVYGRADFGAELLLRQGFKGIRIVGEGAADNLGKVVGSAGDFNGDGNLDVLALASHSDAGILGNTKVYVFYGSGSKNPPFLIHEVFPTYGSVRGGVEVAIRGSGFLGSPQVRFGDQSATGVVLVSGTALALPAT